MNRDRISVRGHPAPLHWTARGSILSRPARPPHAIDGALQVLTPSRATTLRFLAVAFVVASCNGAPTEAPVATALPTTAPPVPAGAAARPHRPLPINFSWNDIACVAPLNIGPGTNYNATTCTVPAQGMRTWFGAIGAPSLDAEYRINADTASPIRAGYASEWFHIEKGWCWVDFDCTRTPMYERIEKSEWFDTSVEGDEVWYGWSLFVATGEPDPRYTYMGQFQQYPSSLPVWMFGKNLYPYPQYCAIYFPTVINNYHCGEGANVQLIRDEDFQGRWHDFVFHARWSSDPAKGFSDMWVDGDQVLGFVGPTLTPGNSVYFKYGIYRWTDAQIGRAHV